MIGRSERLGQATGGVIADGKQSISQTSPTEMTHPIKTLPNRRRHRSGLGLTGQSRQLLHQSVSVFVLDVESHGDTFLPA